MTFEELDLTDDVLDALYDMNFRDCTPIQEQAIPAALAGRDLIAVAQTGTGKTAAFLLPVINELGQREPSEKVKCVVMTPTRELAIQIDTALEGFSYFLPISSLAVYGGTDGAGFAQQQRALKNGVEVIIATPGRLLAHMQMGYVDLSEVEFFILDEADRMLDMGFYDDIMSIASHLPKEGRRTMMFSATMPDKIQKLAASVLDNPVEIKIAVSRPTEKIDQSAYIVPEAGKTPLLCHLFENVNSKRVIVFASSKLKVKELSRSLRRMKLNVGEMHSDLDQEQRDEVMHGFRAGTVDILVATDIVARGIDIDDITMVVNYDVPHDAEDYVHRIGRTARANADGVAITLVGEKDRRKFRDIERFLGYSVRKGEIPAELGISQSPATPAENEKKRGDRHGGGASGSRGRKEHGDRKDHGGKHKAGAGKNAGRRPEEGTPAAKAASEAPQPKGDSALEDKGKSKGGARRRNFRRRPRAAQNKGEQ
ncbi:MAG: DEAD/DEAH box helicase [Muribaculaceae bacterium]|nr:DEAD/DEAH box helicase [Muribaculaceae bacterium]